MKKIRAAYSSAWKLTKDSRRTLIILLLTVTLFKVEVPLVVPYIIRWIYEAIATDSISAIIWATGKGLSIFSLNVVLMYFMNVYGDSWAMKLAFCAAKNSYIRISDYPVSSIKYQFGNSDVFNRIVSGTGQIVGLWFVSIDIFSAVVATVIILTIFARQARIIFGLVFFLVFVDVMRAVCSYFKLKKLTASVEEKRSNRVNYLKSYVENHTFHIMNSTAGYMMRKYQDAREENFKITEKKVNLTALFDAVSEVVHNIFIVVLGNSYFELKKESRLTTAEINSSYNLFLSVKDTVNALIQSIISFSGEIIPIERLNNIIIKETKKALNQKELLSLEKCSFHYGDKQVLYDISIKIKKGEKVAIIGDNGCGKSTLLKYIAGLLQEESGRNALYKSIAYLPAELLLFNSQSAYRNICMGNSLDKEKARLLLFEVGIQNGNKLLEQSCMSLSGGEKQRIALLRSYVMEKELILWDEPTAALDSQSFERIELLLKEIDATVVYVTHSPELAKCADRICIMRAGRIISCVVRVEAENNEFYQNWLSNREGMM